MWKHRTKSRKLLKLFVVMPGSKSLLTCLELSLICAMGQGCLKIFQMGKAFLRKENKPAKDDQKMKEGRGRGEKTQAIKEPSSKMKTEKWLSISNTGHDRENGKQDKGLKRLLLFTCVLIHNFCTKTPVFTFIVQKSYRIRSYSTSNS